MSTLASPAWERAADEPEAATVTVVVPVLNAMEYLPRTAPAVVAAVRGRDARAVFADHGSTDGSYEYLRSLVSDQVRVIRVEGGTIGGVRNAGARAGTGPYLAFIDADCLMPECFLDEAIDALERTGAAATGCEMEAPADGHWIERALHMLHYVGRDRYVHYINSGDFVVTRAAFDAVGGFSEVLPTGEDAEICARLTAAKLPIWECTRVGVVHLGNPKSVRGYWRRTVWHALGMFGTVGGPRFDRPTAMMAAHLLLSLAGAALLAWQGVPLSVRVPAALALQLPVPVLTVVYRWVNTRRVSTPASGLVLYWLYYWARLWALVLIITGRGHRYRK